MKLAIFKSAIMVVLGDSDILMKLMSQYVLFKRQVFSLSYFYFRKISVYNHSREAPFH